MFNLVHQDDLPWLLDRPWARLSLIWVLSLLGIAISSTGMFLSWRVVRRR